MGEAASVGEEGLSRVPVVLVLPDRILHVLPVERILELGREDGDAIQEEREIDALLRLLAEAELADDGEEVGPVQALQFLVEPARRAEVRQPELAARVLNPVSQHVERPPPGDLARQPPEEARLHVGSVVLLQLLPLLRLGGQEEVMNVGPNEAEPTVVVLRMTSSVAAWHRLGAVCRRGFPHGRGVVRARIGPVPQQRALNHGLEGPFGYLGAHDASSRKSILPVTAAEIRAVRNCLR